MLASSEGIPLHAIPRSLHFFLRLHAGPQNYRRTVCSSTVCEPSILEGLRLARHLVKFFSLLFPLQRVNSKAIPKILRLSLHSRYLRRTVLPSQSDTLQNLMPADRTNHTMSAQANGRGRGRGRGRGARGRPNNQSSGPAPARNASTLIPAQVPYTVVKPEEPEAAPVLKKHLSDTKFQDFVVQGCS